MNTPKECLHSQIEEALDHIAPDVEHTTYQEILKHVTGALDGDREAAEKILLGWSEEIREGQYQHDLENLDETGSLDGLLDVAQEHGYSSPRGPEAKTSTGKKQSDVDRLLQLVDDIEPFRSPSGALYATFQKDNTRETARIESDRFSAFLEYRFFSEFGRPVSSRGLKRVISMFRARAKHGDKMHQVYLRVAQHDGAVFIDLGDDTWDAIRVTSKGRSIDKNPPVRFRRTPNTRPLPRPAKNGDLSLLRKHVPMRSDEDFALLLGWMVYSLQPRGPFPILSITGPQGSGKSTITRMVSSLLSPSSPELRDMPTGKRDLAIAANGTWVLPFDNQDTPSPQMSDALCRLSTKGGFTIRKLYSDREEEVFEAERPIILNGITDLLERSDLLDRSVVFQLRSIRQSERKTEEKIWNDFQADEPKIFAGLLDAIAMALSNIGDTELESTPRMADFAKWSVAAEPAFPTPNGTFIRSYLQNRENASRSILEKEPAVKVIYEHVKEHGRWEGNTEDLMRLLEEGLSDHPGASAPDNVQKMTSLRDRVIKPILQQFGVVHERLNERRREFAFIDAVMKEARHESEEPLATASVEDAGTKESSPDGVDDRSPVSERLETTDPKTADRGVRS